jgi:dienelactone hydrolase
MVAVVVVVATEPFGGGDGPAGRVEAGRPASSSSTAATTGPPTTTVPTTDPPSTTVPASLPVDREYPVRTATRTFVDPSRPTSPNGGVAGAPDRTLAVHVWYPDGPGPFPLVVFSHGYAVTPDFYAPMLERWAAAGYVVAAPTYPILSGEPGGASHVDYEQTFADTSFVITQLLAIGPGDAVGALVDPTRIAAAGHSDGEVIAFGVGFLECCRDPRVRAVVAMAGNLENANNPHVRDTGTPILHVMETGDEYDPYPASIAWDRANLTGPRWMLTLEGATHVPPYQVPGDPHFELLADAVVDFLDGTLKGHPDRLDRMAATAAAAPTLASLER